MRIFMVLLAFVLFAFAKDGEISLEDGVAITLNGKAFVIKRETPKECVKDAMSFTPDTLWGGDWASELAPKECKKSFITTFGKLSPMVFHPEVATVGEIEVAKFIRDHHKDPNFVLVDSRMEAWFEEFTLPTAISVSFLHVSKPEGFGDKHFEALKKLGVSVQNGKYDFSKAKTALFFCNGAWCAQSGIMMKWLIDKGYPAKKMLWYRDGIQGWLQYGLPVVEP